MAHTNELYHISTTHGTYEWVMAHLNDSCHLWKHMNESCHIWIRHITYEWVMSHVNESYHIWMSHVTCEWVILHMNESCHLWSSKRRMILRSLLIVAISYYHMNESCRIRMSHLTSEWLMSPMNASRHVWMSHVTSERLIWHDTFKVNLQTTKLMKKTYRIKMSLGKYESATSNLYNSCHTFFTVHMNESWHIYE